MEIVQSINQSISRPCLWKQSSAYTSQGQKETASDYSSHFIGPATFRRGMRALCDLTAPCALSPPFLHSVGEQSKDRVDFLIPGDIH